MFAFTFNGQSLLSLSVFCCSVVILDLCTCSLLSFCSWFCFGLLSFLSLVLLLVVFLLSSLLLVGFAFNWSFAVQFAFGWSFAAHFAFGWSFAAHFAFGWFCF